MQGGYRTACKTGHIFQHERLRPQAPVLMDEGSNFKVRVKGKRWQIGKCEVTGTLSIRRPSFDFIPDATLGKQVIVKQVD